jgi:TonB-linked SusC/RagA family outer membrane protein
LVTSAGRRIRGLATAFVALALLAPTAALFAQGGQTATITGRVLDRASNQPLTAAQVVVVGTQRGAITGEDGSYRISGVAPGRVQLRAQRIGYEAQTQLVAANAGETVTANFTLGTSAIQLDEVVTTATGETQRRRESGNVVATILPDPERLAVASNMSEVLNAKAPGVYVNTSGGTIGGANRIRIRGASSVSLNNEPLLIIDGVRLNNDIVNTTNVSGGVGVGGQTSGRLNDLNPEDIESIEVIKGPAAAALYGTAGANGVIQVRTKRGQVGRTRWTTFIEAGELHEVTNYPANFAREGTRTSNGTITNFCTLNSEALGLCVPTATPIFEWNPLEDASPFIDGWRTQYGLSVSGGGDALSYFVSGDLEREQGVLDPNRNRKVNIRANLHSQLRDNLDLSVNTAYLQSRLNFPQNDNNILGVLGGGLLGFAFDDPVARGYLAGQTPAEIFALQVNEDVDRFISSVNANWQITPWLTAVGTTGLDYLDRRNQQLVPPNRVFFGALPEGNRQSNPTAIWNYTLNTGLTANFDLVESLRSSTSVGVQYTQEKLSGPRAFGAKLLGGTGSLAGVTARFAVNEANTDNKTLGAYVQEQLAYRDRLFLTLAARTDNNSAFGENFGWITYPAASLSYVISEEGFWPQNSFFNNLRLRTAYGQSGQRPSFRDAITYFSAQTVELGGVDQPGVTLGGTGNIDLKPERSSEFEVGFDAGFLDGRIGLEFTYYDKQTKDLLIARPLPPSLGLSASRFENLGKSSNKGIEMLLNAQIVSFENFKFDVTGQYSTNSNKLIDLGTLPNGNPVPAIVFGRQQHRNGLPLGGYFQRGISFNDANNDGIIDQTEITLTDTSVYLGNPLPKKEWAITPRVEVFKYFTVTALFDHKGDFFQFNNTDRFRCNFLNCIENYDRNQPLDRQAANLGQALGTDAGYIEKGDYTKLREVTLTIAAPQSWARRVRTSALSLTLAGRNLKTWTDYRGFDPEVNSTPTANFGTSDFLTLPPLRAYSARLNVAF